MKQKTAVIIPSAGSGVRMNSPVKKQFIEIYGKPILWHTINIFESHNLIDEIIVVGPQSDLVHIEEMCNTFTKVKHIVAGGKLRQDSIMNGYKYVSDNVDNILVHDGVRPFVDKKTINELIEVLKSYNCGITGIPIYSTVKRVNTENFVEETLNRDELWEIQTPQGLKKTVFETAYNKAIKDHFYGTDEAMIAEYNKIPVKLVLGSKRNIKITTPEDIDFCHFLMEKMQQK